ncbi:MAG: DoxX family protein [Gemmatimonadota bacterium]
MKKEWSPELLSVLRIIVAFLYFQHGAAKWFAFPAAVMPGSGVAAVGSLPWFAGVIETIGGVFILLGLFTRPVAFILAGEMAFAYFIGHAGRGFWPTLNQGEPAVFYCFTYLYFSAAGAGPWSLDALLARRRGTTIPVS